jgi:hypothetical protein
MLQGFALLRNTRSRDSSVDGLRAGRLGFDSRQGQKLFSTRQRPGRPWGPPGLMTTNTWGSSPGVKAAGE